MKEEEVNEEEDKEGHWNQLEFLCVWSILARSCPRGMTHIPSPATEQPASARTQREGFTLTRTASVTRCL
jgi:hypothetical protein